MSCIHCVHPPSDLSELLWIQKAYVKMEQEEYSKETIDWGNIEFIDNQIALDLTEKVAEAKSLLLGCLRTSPSMNLPSCCLTGFLLAHHATLRLWLRRLQRRRL